MKILYVSSMIEENMIGSIYDKGCLPGHAASKYHQLLCKGLSENGHVVNAYTSLPVSSLYSTKRYIKIPEIREGNLNKKYISVINFPVVKHIMLFVKSFFKALLSPKDTVIVYDALVISSSLGALLASKLRGIKSVAIVTDLPCHMHRSSKDIKLAVNNGVLSFANGFVFLTEQMNEAANPKSKPFVVLEGHVDINMQTSRHTPFSDENKKIIYAGGLHEKYGIAKLVDAFLVCHKKNEELCIYGDGDYADQLNKIACANSCIKFFGSRPNSEIVEAELQATLLVNPRTSEGEYTRYSFPSKTLEYMVSGTPVLMAKLPGIPDEYDDYVYYFDEHDERGLEKALRRVLDKPCFEMKERGRNARRFVLAKKNNVVQAKRISEFINFLGE